MTPVKSVAIPVAKEAPFVPNTPFLKAFASARRVSTPLIAVQTPDPAAAIQSIRKLISPNPIVCWDIVNGLAGLNPAGEDVLKKACGGELDPKMLNNPTEALALAVKFPTRTAFFFMNAQRFLDSPSVPQAMWNLRDAYKQDYRTLILLCPSITLPPELTQDVMVLDEPLPEADDLSKLIVKLHESASLKQPDAKILEKAVDATKGLSAFTAEQSVAMSLTKAGIDLDQLWERKRKTVEQTPGLSIWRGKENYDDVRGVENIKTFLTRLFTGNEPPSVIVFLDELEKMVAGAGGDLSGVSQEMHGEFLSWMADNEISGLIAVGHPGCSKSHLAKATGGNFSVPTVVLNISALKGSLVGQSGQQLRQALKVIKAIGRPFLLATSNNLDSLAPELRSRFTAGTFFFDLPTDDERAAIWDLYIRDKKITPAQLPIPQSEGWTGREIRACCDIAWKLNCSLDEASKYIVPVVKSSPEKIERLRIAASGRFINASASGVYQYGDRGVVKQQEGPRALTLGVKSG